MPEFSVLKKRRSFVRLTKGAFCVAARTLVLQAMESEKENVSGNPRIGYTTTKKIGKAHTRNRCRRRLRAAAALLFAKYAMPGFDYVLVARYTTEKAKFAVICEDLVYALKKARANFVNSDENGE